MTPLRRRMIEDMRVRSLAADTNAALPTSSIEQAQVPTKAGRPTALSRQPFPLVLLHNNRLCGSTIRFETFWPLGSPPTVQVNICWKLTNRRLVAIKI